VTRLTSALLVLALTFTWAQVSALHVHRYTDHDHPEHHHGPAAHEHHADSQHGDDGAARLETCDPGTHATSFVFVSSAPPDSAAFDVELDSRPAILAPLTSRLVLNPPDRRAHGPPVVGQTSPRAPPPTFPA
jgi:hypothetical protein